MKQLLQEFKEFAMKGSVIDLAVWIVVGTAFSGIVSSLVDNVIMPVVGIVMQGIDFTTLSIGIGDAQIMYGQLIQALLNFIIVAFALFLVIKAINTAQSAVKKPKKPAEPAVPSLTTDQELLTEIRDLLKKNK